MVALAKQTGIPLNLIRMAKKLGFPGWRANQNVSWRELKPTFEARYDELISALDTDIIGLKEQLMQRDLRLKDLEITKKEKDMLDPEDVKRLLISLATTTSVVVRKELGELPPRLLGLDEPSIKVELEKALQAIFKALKAASTYSDKDE
jgi:hypothetical protein